MKNVKEGVRAVGKAVQGGTGNQIWFCRSHKWLKPCRFQSSASVFIILTDFCPRCYSWHFLSLSSSTQWPKEKKRAMSNPAVLLQIKTLNSVSIDLHLKTDLNLELWVHAFLLNDWKPCIFAFFHPAFELICLNCDRGVTGTVRRQVGNARSCNLYCWAFTNTVKEIRVIPPRLSGKLGSDLQTQNWYKIYFPGNRRNNLPPFMLQWEKLCLGRGNRIVCCWCTGGTAASARCSSMWRWSPGEFSRYAAPEILTARLI